ncbi:MAG: DUF2239 family protein [Bdellovibrionota bacterium]
MNLAETYTAFDGTTFVAKGPLESVVAKIKKISAKTAPTALLIFSDTTGVTIDLDLSGSPKEIAARMRIYLPREESESSKGPGRPRLGVIAREISLLPQHWEWLATQSGGASASLRRLVEDAKKSSLTKNLTKQAQERTYKFISVLAGDLPRYEEALRALYRKNEDGFREEISAWPKDIRRHAQELAAPVFESEQT